MSQLNYLTQRIWPARSAVAYGFFIVALLLLLGCKRDETPPPAAMNASKPPARFDQAPILSEEDSELVKAAGPLTEADKAWRDLQSALQPPAYPPEWKDKPPTKEQIGDFEKKSSAAAAEAANKVRQFHTKYSTNDNAAEARKREYDLLKIAVDLGHTNSIARLETLEAEELKKTSLPEDQRIEIRVQQIQRLMAGTTSKTMADSLPKVEKAVRSLQADFPDRTDLASLSMSVAELWLDAGNVQKSRALAEEVVNTKAPDEVKENAQMLIKKLNRVGKPLELKFTSLDGKAVDLQALKGKVVLLDFWATWCAPCMRELPNVKATYAKFHDQGFEILGISYDDKKEILRRTVSNEKMTWPQYFDEDGAKKFAEDFGVMTIPTMWLIDKKGILRDLTGVRDLSGKVEKLLAEK